VQHYHLFQAIPSSNAALCVRAPEREQS
jgi:hypothetical protein